MTVEALFEESFKYAIEADKALYSIKNIDEFSLIFEAENDDVRNQVNANNKSADNSIGFLQKSINALKNIINEIITAIKNMFSYIFASKEDKAAFKKFKDACLADPELRDKKITYLDYKEIHKQYDDAIAEAERLEREIAAGKQADVDAFLKRSGELIKGVSKAAVTSIGLQAVEQIMYNEETVAKGISIALRNDSRILNEIERSLGASRAKDFQKKAEVAAGERGRISLLRFRIMLQRRKQQDIEQVMKKFSSDLRSQFQSKAKFFFGTGMDLLRNKETREIIKGNDGVSREIRDTAIGVAKAVKDAKVHGAAQGVKARANGPIDKFKKHLKEKRELKERDKNNARVAHLAKFFKLDKKQDQQ